METFKDKYGYERFICGGVLVHRKGYFDEHPEGARAWHVHHIDGNKENNKLDNLILLHPKDHKALHGKWPMKNLPNLKEIGEWLLEERWAEIEKGLEKDKDKVQWEWLRAGFEFGWYLRRNTVGSW